MNGSTVDRFFAKVDLSGDSDCWVWTGALNEGYGRFHVAQGEPLAYAHRWLYEQLFGKVDPSLDLDHLCRNRACVHPLHLEPVTRRENLMRGDTLTRAHHDDVSCGSTTCKNCRRFAEVQS